MSATADIPTGTDVRKLSFILSTLLGALGAFLVDYC